MTVLETQPAKVAPPHARHARRAVVRGGADAPLPRSDLGAGTWLVVAVDTAGATTSRVVRVEHLAAIGSHHVPRERDNERHIGQFFGDEMDRGPRPDLHCREPHPAKIEQVGLIRLAKDSGAWRRGSLPAPLATDDLALSIEEGVIDLAVWEPSRDRDRAGNAVASGTAEPCGFASTVVEDELHGRLLLGRGDGHHNRQHHFTTAVKRRAFGVPEDQETPAKGAL